MIYLLIHAFIVIVWLLLSGSFTLWNALLGLVIGYVLVAIASPAEDKRSYVKRLPAAINLFIYFIFELIKANLVVAWEMIDPRHTMNPGIVSIPLDLQSPVAITLLANLITLTPGTLTLEVTEDRKTLFVHAMYIYDQQKFRDSIKRGFERRVMEVFE